MEDFYVKQLDLIKELAKLNSLKTQPHAKTPVALGIL